MRRDDWKMILKDGKAQLYNLNTDLGETTNVVAANPKVAKAMRQAIEEFKRSSRGVQEDGGAGLVETVKGLQGFGPRSSIIPRPIASPMR